jgi:AraC-like DNA-binding protein
MSELGGVNAVLNARGSRYEMRPYRGPLSLKSMVRGSAIWETDRGHFDLAPGALLILNEGEEYSLTVESLHPVETFCVFFEQGFVEDAVRAASAADVALLDEPFRRGAVEFAERIHYGEELRAAVDGLRVRIQRDEESSLHSLAELLARLHTTGNARARALPVARASTRQEIARRLARGVAYIHGHLDRPLRLAEIAREAALSPFHFHRLFRAAWGETVHGYIRRLRLDRARCLLRETGRPIADLALDCGFESVGSFTTLFSRQCGVSPARFRKIEEEARRGRH